MLFRSTLTIRVTSVQTSATDRDRPPTGPSKGDSVSSTDRLVNTVAQFGRSKGAVVGTDRGRLVFTGARSARYDGTARLPGGTLRVRGAVVAVSASVLRVPVVGGSGVYAGARGYLLIGPGARRAENVYALVIPEASVA